MHPDDEAIINAFTMLATANNEYHDAIVSALALTLEQRHHLGMLRDQLFLGYERVVSAFVDRVQAITGSEQVARDIAIMEIREALDAMRTDITGLRDALTEDEIE